MIYMVYRVWFSIANNFGIAFAIIVSTTITDSLLWYWWSLQPYCNSSLAQSFFS